MDHRVDVYAAGVILYEACAGQLPFEHDDLHMLLLLVAAGGALPLSTHRPDLPSALSDAIARAMDPDPELRFSSAAEFAAVLGEIAREIPADLTCRRRRDAFGSIARRAALRPTPQSFLSETPAEPAMPLSNARNADLAIAVPSSPSEIAAEVVTGIAPRLDESPPSSVAPTQVGQPVDLVRRAPPMPRAVWAKLRRASRGRRSVWVASGAVVVTASLVVLLAGMRDADPPVRRRPPVLGASFIGPALARVPLVQKHRITTTSPLAGGVPPLNAVGMTDQNGSGPARTIKHRAPRPPRDVFRTPGF
jgi:hypothetical protein